MRSVAVILQILFLVSLLIYIGCEPPSASTVEPSQVAAKPPTRIEKAADAQDYSGYMPAKVDIMPLTELVLAPHAKGSSKLRIYISLLDSFDCQMKSPGVFRFELYEWVSLSAEPGKKSYSLAGH
jgi:hypothetical protein